MTTKRKGLGRGLDALLNPVVAPKEKTPFQAAVSEQKTAQGAAKNTAKKAVEVPTLNAEPVSELLQSNSNVRVREKKEGLKTLPIEWLKKGRYQPRRDMTESGLEELADSIKAQGIIQPIVVKPLAKESFEIIAGERRWRAAQLAGLDRVPCVVRQVDDKAVMAMALIENIQREDLNPIDEALALQRLIDECGITQHDLAQQLGKSRTSITNLLRLLGLNHDTKRFVENGDLSLGHAKVLLAVQGDKQSECARVVVEKALSVRETERLVKAALEPKQTTKSAIEEDPNILRLATDLSEKLGAPVKIQDNGKGKGKLVIEYHNLDALDGILSRF